MNRDNILWNILLGTGLVAGIIANADPTGLGLTPIVHNWINITALCVTAIGGFFGKSPLRGASDVAPKN